MCERERVGQGKEVHLCFSLIFIIKAFDSHVVSVFIPNWLKIEKGKHLIDYSHCKPREFPYLILVCGENKT